MAFGMLLKAKQEILVSSLRLMFKGFQHAKRSGQCAAHGSTHWSCRRIAWLVLGWWSLCSWGGRASGLRQHPHALPACAAQAGAFVCWTSLLVHPTSICIHIPMHPGVCTLHLCDNRARYVSVFGATCKHRVIMSQASLLAA